MAPMFTDGFSVSLGVIGGWVGANGGSPWGRSTLRPYGAMEKTIEGVNALRRESLRRSNPPMAPMFTDGVSVFLGVNRWTGRGERMFALGAAPCAPTGQPSNQVTT